MTRIEELKSAYRDSLRLARHRRGVPLEQALPEALQLVADQLATHALALETSIEMTLRMISEAEL
jgi:hypothetical protein